MVPIFLSKLEQFFTYFIFLRLGFAHFRHQNLDEYLSSRTTYLIFFRFFPREDRKKKNIFWKNTLRGGGGGGDMRSDTIAKNILFLDMYMNIWSLFRFWTGDISTILMGVSFPSAILNPSSWKKMSTFWLWIHIQRPWKPPSTNFQEKLPSTKRYAPKSWCECS